MAIDIDHAAAYVDIMPTERVEKRRRGKAALAIGAIIILSDGSQCQVVGYDAQGRPLCAPVQP
jgi:hypothetical protein